jgi:hypothetical protein
MLSPSSLSIDPSVAHLQMGAYDFDSQKRKGEPLQYYTFNSIQTYDNSGRPSDANGDNYD